MKAEYATTSVLTVEEILEAIDSGRVGFAEVWVTPVSGDARYGFYAETSIEEIRTSLEDVRGNQKRHPTRSQSTLVQSGSKTKKSNETS